MDTDRQIPGLMPRTRRRANLAPLGATEPPEMQESNSTDAPVSNADAISSESLSAQKATQPSRQRNRAAEPSTSAAEGEKVQLGVKVSAELKGRARAAFKEVAYHEDVATFERFCSMALEAAIKQVEAKYNGGEEFEPREQNLRRGRPVA